MKLSKKHMTVIFAVTGFFGALSLCLVSYGLFGTAADRHRKALADRPANSQPRIEDRWEYIGYSRGQADYPRPARSGSSLLRVLSSGHKGI